MWPGDAVYPDFQKNETTAPWWRRQLDAFYELLPFDGLWEDMNEASNFCVGACYESQKSLTSQKYNMTYIPGGRDLNVQSIDVDATHSNGFTELDMHSLFGTMEVRATHEWFQNR